MTQFTMGLSILCQLPQDLDISKKLNDAVMEVLYGTLSHPPASFIGSDVSFASNRPNGTYAANGAPVKDVPAATQGTSVPRWTANFRSADGSGNNPLIPSLGQAGTPYARSVQNKHPLPANVLPDSGLVFDALLKARDVSSFSSGGLSIPVLIY